MNNIQKSELVIAKILGLLMEWGLTASELEFSELELNQDFEPFFDTCIEWLISEGIIRVQKMQKLLEGPAYISGPTLTAYGFQLMGKTIVIGEKSTTVGDAVQKAAKESSYYTGIADFGGGFVGGLLKSLGNG